MQKLGSLQPSDTYSNGKYKVWKSDEDSITIVRIADNHIIVFHKGSVNWDWMVKKD